MFEQSDERKKRTIILIAVIAVVAVALVFLLRSCGKSPEVSSTGTYTYERDRNSERGELTQTDEKEVVKELNEKVREGMINISMNLCPVFEDGKSAGNLFIYNDPINTHPQMVDIILKDSGRRIYSSKGIDVGSKIEYAPLDVSLEAGEYRCTAYFSAIDENTGEILGKAGADITITILN